MKYAAMIGVVVIAALATGAAFGAGGLKVGVVDMKRVYDESKYKAEYEQKWQEFVKRKNLEGIEMRQRIEDLKRDRWLLTEEAARKKGEEITRKERELNKFALEAQREIEEQKRRYMKEFQDKITQIVEEIATAEGYDFVLNRAFVIFNKKSQDLTGTVLAKLNELYDTEHRTEAAEAANAVSAEASGEGDSE